MSFDCFFFSQICICKQYNSLCSNDKVGLKNADIYSFRLPRVTKPKQKSVNFLSETGLPTEMNTAI